MKKLSLEEKIKIIEESNNLDDIALSALPNVYGDSYYFVSYSHKDYKKVYVDILKLQEAGINIWYDRGLVPGKSWQDYADEAIAKHNCIGVIFYLSENSLVSKAIAHEIEYVKNIGKDFLSINLPIESTNNIISAQSMLELPHIKDTISKESYDIVSNTFNNEVIYLKYTDLIESKIEKISALKKPNLINYLLDNDNNCKVLSTNSIDIKHLDLPNNTIFNDQSRKITSIEECAFANCKYLETISLSKYCLEIKDRAFFGCNNLKEIEIPEEVIQIGKYTFGDCINLKSINFTSNNLETIRQGAFSNCKNLKEIIIPPSVKSIEYGAFEGNQLYKISISNNTSGKHFYPYYSIDDNCLIQSIEKNDYKNKRTILKALRHDRLYKKIIVAGQSVGDIEINARADEIAPLAYKDCNKLTSITIPSRIKVISEQSFYGCNKLSSLTFKDPYKFQNNLQTKILNLSKELVINKEAFSNCSSLEEVIFPQFIQSIGMKAFSNCTNLKKVDFLAENDIYNILDYAFENCTSLEEITIPSSVKRIGDGAFKNCTNLKKVVFEDNSKLTFLGDGAFEGCSNLVSINLPNSLTTLNNDLFKDCLSLKEIKIPNSITTIRNPFFNCSSLEKIVFPSNTKISNIYCLLFVDNKNVIIEYNKRIKDWHKINQSQFLSSLGRKRKSFASIIRNQYKKPHLYPNKPGIRFDKTLLIENRNLVKCKDGNIEIK